MARRYRIKEVRAMVVLKVTIGTWMAIYFKTIEVSWVKGSPSFFPNPCLTDRVKKTVDTMARI